MMRVLQGVSDYEGGEGVQQQGGGIVKTFAASKLLLFQVKI